MVASIAVAAAAAASVGVKPQAEAPHSAPVAPRNALRRRLRRRTCTARARAQRHRSVLRARAGPTWESERSSSVARARQGARRKGRAGRWQMERWLGAAPSSPGTGRSGAEDARIARWQKKVGGRTDARIKGGPSQYPERLLRSPFSGSPGFGEPRSKREALAFTQIWDDRPADGQTDTHAKKCNPKKWVRRPKPIGSRARYFHAGG